MTPLARERWQLTPDAFRELLASLDPEDATAAAKRYEMLRERLLIFFQRKQLGFAEDMADEVLNRLARRIHEGEFVQNIESYALGIAGLVARERLYKLCRERAAHEEFFRIRSIQDDPAATEERLARMEAALRQLGSPEHALLVSYYEGEGRNRIRRRQHIANHLGISAEALRKRVFDLKEALRRALTSSRFSRQNSGTEL